MQPSPAAMTPSIPPGPRDARQQLVHDVRNAINAIVTSGLCLTRCEEIPPDYRRFVDAIQENGDRARLLLDQLDEELARR